VSSVTQEFIMAANSVQHLYSTRPQYMSLLRFPMFLAFASEYSVPNTKHSLALVERNIELDKVCDASLAKLHINIAVPAVTWQFFSHLQTKKSTGNNCATAQHHFFDS